MNLTTDRKSGARGFTLIELLMGMTVLTFGLVAVATMFPVGFVVVSDAGKMTMTMTGARSIIEDVRSVPFANLTNLNGFDTANSLTLPASQPERDIARRWRYAIAGEGQGFTFTSTEKAAWSTLSTTSANLGARGTIAVVAQTATLRLVTVTLTVPGRPNGVTMATIISRM
jgi:prepilin-type N-terminal cleavage/methylation domain-containing protein